MNFLAVVVCLVAVAVAVAVAVERRTGRAVHRVACR
jgi:hypothetical protein